jgi:hypothetical protein
MLSRTQPMTCRRLCLLSKWICLGANERRPETRLAKWVQLASCVPWSTPAGYEDSCDPACDTVSWGSATTQSRRLFNWTKTESVRRRVDYLVGPSETGLMWPNRVAVIGVRSSMSARVWCRAAYRMPVTIFRM